jgi:hypothetical protein
MALLIIVEIIVRSHNMTGKTGERVVIGGIYKCQEHPEATKTFVKGTVFLPCGRAGSHGTTWILVRKTP